MWERLFNGASQVCVQKGLRLPGGEERGRVTGTLFQQHVSLETAVAMAVHWGALKPPTSQHLTFNYFYSTRRGTMGVTNFFSTIYITRNVAYYGSVF